MNVKETILAEHKTLKRIEELQKFMHETSALAIGLHEGGLIEQPEDKLMFFETMHAFSHKVNKWRYYPNRLRR